MEVVRFSKIDDLQVHAGEWDRLAAGIPFRSWAWLSTWWRHYAANRQLYVLGVFDDDELVAIAPWYRTLTPQHGRTLRLMGDTEICSEYTTIVCRPGIEQAACNALAEWLRQPGRQDRWDTAELSAAGPDDTVPAMLGQQMLQRGCRLHSQPGPGCWRVDLPATWDDYLHMLSKDRRKKLRRLQREYVDTGRAKWHTAKTLQQLQPARQVLVDLHQRRRNSLGQSGCFSWPRYNAFHQEVLPMLLGDSSLGLHWLELDGRPIAAEYHLWGPGTVYCYQGGIAPEDARYSPGQIATLFAFRESIKRGDRAFDFLRGDEPYKQHWRARLHTSVELRVVAPRTAAQLHHGIWLTGLDLKHWIKDAMGTFHLR